jgi:hypothetical protein
MGLVPDLDTDTPIYEGLPSEDPVISVNHAREGSSSPLSPLSRRDGGLAVSGPRPPASPSLSRRRHSRPLSGLSCTSHGFCYEFDLMIDLSRFQRGEYHMVEANPPFLCGSRSTRTVTTCERCGPSVDSLVTIAHCCELPGTRIGFAPADFNYRAEAAGGVVFTWPSTPGSFPVLGFGPCLKPCHCSPIYSEQNGVDRGCYWILRFCGLC